MFERKFKTVDCHTHLRKGVPSIGCLYGEEQRWRHDSCCALSLEGNGPGFQDQNALCLAFKRKYPQMYAFGGLNHKLGDFKAQAESLWAAGVDGFKMIEGKPDTWKRWGVRLDDPCYDGFYSFCQSQGAPVLLHTADPDEFWDIERITKEDIELGWYWDSTYPTKEDLTAQTLGILEKFPRLKLIMAHFFFLADDLPRLSRLFDTYPGLYLDITPGSPPYEHFARDIDATRCFFTKYKTRILYGTDSIDMFAEADCAYMDGVVDMVQRFLETSDDMEMWGLKLKGASMPAEVQRAVYSENFLRLAPHRELNLTAAEDCVHRAAADSRQTLSDDERQVIQALWG